MPSFALPVTHVSGTPVTYVPSLYRGDKGEGDPIAERCEEVFLAMRHADIHPHPNPPPSRGRGFVEFSARRRRSKIPLDPLSEA